MPNASAAILTSLVGGIFTLVGAIPFLARFIDRLASPVPPMAWVLLWLALAGLGWLIQTWRGDPDEADDTGDVKDEPTSPARAATKAARDRAKHPH
jgi:hypothetical protein